MYILADEENSILIDAKLIGPAQFLTMLNKVQREESSKPIIVHNYTNFKNYHTSSRQMVKAKGVIEKAICLNKLGGFEAQVNPLAEMARDLHLKKLCAFELCSNWDPSNLREYQRYQAE